MLRLGQYNKKANLADLSIVPVSGIYPMIYLDISPGLKQSYFKHKGSKQESTWKSSLNGISPHPRPLADAFVGGASAAPQNI